jgi:Glyoxalase-like domain
MSGSPSAARLPPVDHLVWGGPNLEQEIERLEAWTGVRALLGGRHPGEGTRNALLRLGPIMYLELIGPDLTQAKPRRPRWLGLDTITGPRLITWAAKSSDLEQQAAAARAAGVALGEVRSGRRELSNGQVLSWRLTYPDVRAGDGLVPFLIDWGDSPHPSLTAPGGIQLVEVHAEHPDPAGIVESLRCLGLELRVLPGRTPALVTTLDTPRGSVELR